MVNGALSIVSQTNTNIHLDKSVLAGKYGTNSRKMLLNKDSRARDTICLLVKIILFKMQEWENVLSDKPRPMRMKCQTHGMTSPLSLSQCLAGHVYFREHQYLLVSDQVLDIMQEGNLSRRQRALSVFR